MWYKSPFRAEERTPSFCVSERGFYDFGISQYYDVIEFVKNIMHCDFQTAVKTLENYYGINTNQYETNDIRRILREQQEHNKRYRQKVEKWYTDNYGYIVNIGEYVVTIKIFLKGKFN